MTRPNNNAASFFRNHLAVAIVGLCTSLSACAQVLPASTASASAPAPATPLATSTSLAPLTQTTAAAEPDWFLPTGQPSPQADAAILTLLDATKQGLNPADYQADQLAKSFAQHNNNTVEQNKDLNARLTQSLVRYLNDLRKGRVEPHKVHQKFDLPAKPDFDAKQYLLQALQNNAVELALAEAQPKVPMYDAVVKAMAHYRTLADDPVWSTPLPPLPTRKLEPGQRYAGMPLIARRLSVLGDLPATDGAAGIATTSHTNAKAATSLPNANPQDPTLYTPELATAVKTFQSRHGLTVDGIIGAGTFAHLNTTPAQRVEQMALTLERLRWTPLLSGPRMIVVNIPEFMLRAYEVKPDGKIDINLQMRVIVGKALDTSTPLFDEDMRFIEFSPYWNVPPSIARSETLPRLRRDPAYFNRQGFEFVNKDGSVSTELTPENLDAVKQGAARIRQRPGTQNALGDIKFIFPNNTNIYLHHTPSPQLFERARRDFSHGCIRIEAPVALAQFVLQNDPRWTKERIEAAMQGGKSQTIKLANPIPVVLAYSTVVVLEGKVFFFEDIYGHDKKLANALKKRA